jgi:hypothetical protein
MARLTTPVPGPDDREQLIAAQLMRGQAKTLRSKADYCERAGHPSPVPGDPAALVTPETTAEWRRSADELDDRADELDPHHVAPKPGTLAAFRALEGFELEDEGARTRILDKWWPS